MDVRKTPDAMTFALLAAQNAAQTAAVGSTYFHLAKTTVTGGDYRAPTEATVQVTAANASSEATRIALANQIKQVANVHFADSVAHDAELTDAITTADATNDATAFSLANALKTAINAHLDETDVHYNDDSTNTVAAANATDASTGNTLLNEIKGDLNAHIANAPPGIYLHLVDA